MASDRKSSSEHEGVMRFSVKGGKKDTYTIIFVTQCRRLRSQICVAHFGRSPLPTPTSWHKQKYYIPSFPLH